MFAVVTVQAGYMVMYEDLVANIEIFDLVPFLCDYSGRLVSKNQWQTTFQIPSHQIRAAHAASLHLHQDFVFLDLW